MSAIFRTNSEMQAYKDCPKYWWFRYVEMLELESEPDPESASGFGTIGHAGMDGAWSAKRDGATEFSQFFAAAERAAKAAGDDGGVTDVLRTSIRGQLQELKTHEVVAIELPFEFRLARGVWFAGKIDLVTRHMGQLVVWDHKFSSQVDGFTRRAHLDTQKFGYCRAVQEIFKEPVTRFAWSVTRRKIPSRPRVLKLTKAEATLLTGGAELLRRQEETGEPMGCVSVAACDTTPEVYLEALLEQQLSRGIDVRADQEEMVRSLKETFGKWFAQEETYVSARQLQDWAVETLSINRRMREDARPGAIVYRNPSRCTGPGRGACDYASPCLSDGPETRGLYKIRANKHAELAIT